MLPLSCTDPTTQLDFLTWKDWAKSTASGAGVLRVCDRRCRPGGKETDYDVVISAKWMKRCTSDSLVYTEIDYRVVHAALPPAAGIATGQRRYPCVD